MSREITITIDDKKIRTVEGKILLWVALANDIYIPHLCAIEGKDLPEASCRLCFVEIEGKNKPVTSCTQPVYDGMVVRTRTAKVDRLVKTAFELLLSDHRLGCASCPKNRNCELQRIAKERKLKLRHTRFKYLGRETAVDDSPDSFSFDPSRCVLCGQCIWADHEKAKVGAIGFARRGLGRTVATFNYESLKDSPCTECGLCVEACPVGALSFKKNT
ncbi:MAG: 4Fe-4S binding protein [Firmicutes bacterium]|nr:4Fe-4S binding protein [Bacillota bacterium]